MASTNIYVGVGFIGAGSLFIASGIRKSKSCSGKTVGKITGVHEEQKTDDEGYTHYSYSPEFEYVVDGQVYHGTGNITYTKRKKIRVGGPIDVFYNPEKPGEYFTKGGKFILPFIGIMMILVGVICIANA